MTPTQACARCPKSAQNCWGACPCLEDGKNITLHQSRGYCPLARFGTAERPDGWDDEPAADAPPPPAPVAIPRERWPLCIKAVALLAKPEDKGVGDTAHRVLAAGGGDALAKLFEQATGRACGCSDRAARLNDLYPY